MATYPTLPTRAGGDPQPIDSIEIDRAEDGTARGRSFYSSGKVRIPLEHPCLNVAQKATLAAFYSANRLIPFDYVSGMSGGATYSCLFSKPPAYTYECEGVWTAKVEMEEA